MKQLLTIPMLLFACSAHAQTAIDYADCSPLSAAVSSCERVLVYTPPTATPLRWTDPSLLALVIASVADGVSTERAISRGGVEANPVMGSHVAQRLVVKSLSTATSVWMLRSLGRRHPRWARGLALGASVLYTSAAVWNEQIGSTGAGAK